MDIYADTSTFVRLAALRWAAAVMAERLERSRYAGADGGQALAPETRAQQAMAQHGVILAAEADARLANGILAVAGTVPGRALDIRV